MDQSLLLPWKVVDLLPVLELADLIGVEVSITPIQVKEGTAALHFIKAMCLHQHPNELGVGLKTRQHVT